MPIYEKECPKCGHKIEYIQLARWANEMIDVCEKCETTMEFVYSVPAVRIFQEYTTTHILPHGKPITITSERHESSVLRENGLCKADSNPTK